MMIFVLIIPFAIFAQFDNVQSHDLIKTPAKRAILGQGHVETVQNSIGDPNKNAYLPPPIQEYPFDKSQYSQQSAAVINSVIEPPASTYLPPFETSPTHHDNFQITPNGFVPVRNSLGSSNSQILQYASQYRASGYLPPEPEQVHLSHPSHFRGPDYLPPVASHPSGHNTASKSPEQSVNQVHHHHSENHKSAYNAPGYLPPLPIHENHINGAAQQLSEAIYRAAGYLPPHPDTTGHVNPIHLSQSTSGAYNAPGYLPPHPDNVGHTNQIYQATQSPDSVYNTPGYLPPHSDSVGHKNTINQGAHNDPGYLPPISHQTISARVPPISIDFEQHDAYKTGGYLPPIGGSNNHAHAQIPHTVYGTPKSHSHNSIYVSPGVNTASVTMGSQYAPSNIYHDSASHAHESHYNNHGEPNYNRHQHEINDHHQHYSAQTQGYAPKYTAHPSHHQNTHTSFSVSSQPIGVPVPHEYTAPTPMYSQNPSTQYAATAPTYQTNNGYLPPHHDLLPPTENHNNINNRGNYYHISTPNSHNNGYLPPIETEQISGEHSGNDVQFTSNQFKNFGSESSQQQYASSFPTYSTNHDGYDYSKPKGASFEDGHHSSNQNYNNLNQNTIMPNELQPNIHVINVGSEGGHQQEFKIIRIIDETKHGDLPNIRTLKIIKETSSVQGEPNHSGGVQTIRIITEPSGSPPVSVNINNPALQNHVSSVPQFPEQHTISNLQEIRSESAGENVAGGYLPPHVALPQQPILVPQSPHISQDRNTHHHISPPITHSTNHNQPITSVSDSTNTPGYLPPLASNAQDIRPPGQGQPYLLPLLASSTSSHNNPTTSNVKVIRILHDSNFDQQQDAIYAGVAEQNSNDINTIRVIHQQEAISGRYGYPSPHSVKLLRYYRRY